MLNVLISEEQEGESRNGCQKITYNKLFFEKKIKNILSQTH